MRLIDADAFAKLLEYLWLNKPVEEVGQERYEAITDVYAKLDGFLPVIEAEPSKLREVIEPYREFCKWVAEWIFKEDFEESAGAFAELACRRLADLGHVFKDGGYWVTVDFEELEE